MVTLTDINIKVYLSLYHTRNITMATSYMNTTLCKLKYSIILIYIVTIQNIVIIVLQNSLF